VVIIFDQDSTASTVEANPWMPITQLTAHENHPGKLVMMGPTYNMPSNVGTGHLSNIGYRWHGEYFGKVLANIVLQQKAWRPLSPRWVKRQGATIIVKFHVPVGPLVIDTSTITPPTYNPT
jgi:hypothetical protein